jgi:predicted HicB family RNase H-like nuclease
MEPNQEKTEELEIELDDSTAAIAHLMAEQRGITVEELIQQVLDEAIQNGYFDTDSDDTLE